MDQYDLTVTFAGNRGNQAPLKQRLPPFYLPQALGHMLPRVLPLNQPKTYMFYTYSSDAGKVMARYVDVGREQQVELGGQRAAAVPVTDRIGLEGSPTVHYLSQAGKYLGSVNSQTRVTVLPSSAEELQKLWANNANLTRPAPAAGQPGAGPAQPGVGAQPGAGAGAGAQPGVGADAAQPSGAAQPAAGANAPVSQPPGGAAPTGP
jgi:hypothetical protein